MMVLLSERWHTRFSREINQVQEKMPSDDKPADVIDAFNTTSRYLDDILNINNVYFDNMVCQIYPSELLLNKANTSDIEAPFLDLHLSISNDIVSTKINDKRDDFDFEYVNFSQGAKFLKIDRKGLT